MKKFTMFFGLLLLAAVTFAQAPQAFKYQAVARGNAGEILANQSVSFRMSILQGALPGTVVYTETHLATTNEFGLVTLEIGRGTPVSGSFTTIIWVTTPIFLKTEIDPAGGSAYVEMGTTELLSVPFALFAQNVAGGASSILLPPTATTEAATEVGMNSATFNGIVNGKGFSTSCYFQYGTTSNYGSQVNATQNPVTGSTDVAVSGYLTGLQSATTYHYRTVASNAVNVSYGEDVTFTTAAGIPVLTTTSVTSVLAFSAVSGGNITYDGGMPVTARGVCWSTNQNPTLSDNFTVDGSGTGTFTSNLTGLTHATYYYVRAYATNGAGTAYGNQVSFYTYTGVGYLTTADVTSRTAISAVSGGNITYDGGDPIIARGVCWGLNWNPTLSSNNFTVDGLGLGTFTSNITGLTPATHYYLRAYATNTIGTFYGQTKEFITEDGYISINTSDVTNITYNSATCGGNITSDGGAPITARGVCWSATNNYPTIEDSFTVDGSGIGSFTSEITGLSVGNDYWVRAYATNVSGTYYGSRKYFSTGIGVSYQGGIIGYILQPGDPGYVEGEVHGLIIAPSDQSDGIPWGCQGTTIGTTLYDIGSGAANTAAIVAGCSQPNIAARICYDLELNGYDDWFLPSADELYEIANELGGLFGMQGANYWSSSEYDTYKACFVTTAGWTNIDEAFKNSTTVRVRAVRAFPAPPQILIPTVATEEVTSITISTAISGGNIIDEGVAPVTARGVVWSTTANPTLEINEGLTNDGNGMGVFVSELTGLMPSTTYFVRAYATNDSGTAYGNERSFTTLMVQQLPTVTTSPITNITESSASGGGEVTYGGTSPVTERGLVWSSSTTNPALDNNEGFTVDGNGIGNFTSELTGLGFYTTYYVKAYATNGSGTAYGNMVEFDTEWPEAPTVITHEITNITENSATGGGEVTDEGFSPVIESGICWNTYGDPTIDYDSYVSCGAGLGTFICELTELSFNTYYVKAFAYNDYGIAYGDEVSFTTVGLSTPGDGVTDIDGNFYTSIILGTQEWMAENLKTTKYANGDPIDNITDETIWYSIDTGAWCWYDNDNQWENPYGKLYNWFAVDDPRNLCPTGWHVPTDSEWTILTDFLGGEDVAGGKMKEPGTLHWLEPNYGATNTSGFTGLPGGYCFPAWSMFGQGIWWSSSEDEYYPLLNAHNRALSFDDIGIYNQVMEKINGYSIRCLKDEQLMNQAPEIPFSPSPDNGAINQSVDVDLSWSCTDPEGDPLTFDVFFGTEATPPQVATGQSATNFDPGTLGYNSLYYWRVVAHDDHGNTTEGPAWSFTTEQLAIGDNFGGGIVAYFLQPGDPGYVEGEVHGLITTPSNLGAALWGCYNSMLNMTCTTCGCGMQNTIEIVTKCNEPGIAARLCYDLDYGGYDDWYLPSICELNKLYENKALIGGFPNGKYWSSSEWNLYYGWYQNFSDGYCTNLNKNTPCAVRPIRNF